MGSRAVLTFDKDLNPNSVGVYLHWHGSLKSVLGILADVRSYARNPEADPSYAFARLVEACCRAAGERQEGSVGVGTLSDLDTDNGDHGTYIIGGIWEIVERRFARESA
jgi:hypothetical protein